MKIVTHSTLHKIIASMKNLTLLFLISMICLAASCNKDDEMPPPKPDLSPLTMEGLNTFGCYINGEPWVAEVPFGAGLSGVRKINAGYNPTTGNFSLFAQRVTSNDSINQKFNLISNIGGNTGLYKFDYYDRVYRDYNFSCISYELDTLENHQLEINHFDAVNKIISGKFEFTVIKSNCQDTFKITEGRFDVTY